jgi:hypothetical protein
MARQHACAIPQKKGGATNLAARDSQAADLLASRAALILFNLL